ncbi:hypothetical protein WG899_11805 [Paucibacter sp. AS339]|uniref:hypothetical protein n=1 Tax=Paucibacter hankyongi TaxID=3133434 RepID=UPI0030B7B22F
MKTSFNTSLLSTFLTALGAVAASAVLGLNLADQAEAQQKVEKQAGRVVTAQLQGVMVQQLPTVLIEGRARS